MGNFHMIRLAAAILALLCAGGMALAGQERPPSTGEDASQWHSTDHARVRLVRAGATGNGRDLAGLVIELENGWHTYWRSPGIYGLPPTFNWEGSENVVGVEVAWPAPEHIIDDYYEAYGYEGRVVLPLFVTREDPDLPARLNLAVGYAVCETICMPVVGYVSMSLPANPRAITMPDYRAQVLDAMTRVPTRNAAAAGIEMEPPVFDLAPDGTQILRLTFTSESSFNDPYLIVEGPKGVTFGATVILLRDSRRRLVATVPVDFNDETKAPMGEGVIVTLTGGRRPVEFLLEPVAED